MHELDSPYAAGVGDGLAAPMARAKAGLSRFAWLAGVGLLVFGAWISFQYARAAWGLDPDVYVPVELWRGVRRFGFGFLATWRYTQDNWVLSLLPFDALLFEVLGPRPAVVAGVGWLVFLASVGLSGVLVARLCSPRAGLIAAVVLLFANVSAMGAGGYLGYPISHNVSMAWALGALALAARSLACERVAPAIAAAACVFVAAVSDPWAGPAIAIPLSLAAGALAVAHRRRRVARYAAGLCAGSLFAFVAAKTRLFGLWSFLPETVFSLADPHEMIVNARWLYVSLAAIFNIVPRADLAQEPAALIDVAAALALFALSLGLLAGRVFRLEAEKALILGVAALSVGALLVLFLVGRWPGHGVGDGRFFPNAYFFGGVVVASRLAQLWAKARPARRWLLAAYPVLLVVSAILSAPRLWASPQPLRGMERPLALAQLLESHGLAYGYGPFWGAEALVMGPITDGRVVIRPVSFVLARFVRRNVESSSLWYRPQAEPGAGRVFLVVIDDGEECRDLQACMRGAERQFGPPAERLPFQGGAVLVWTHRLIDRIAP